MWRTALLCLGGCYGRKKHLKVGRNGRAIARAEVLVLSWMPILLGCRWQRE